MFEQVWLFRARLCSASSRSLFAELTRALRVPSWKKNEQKMVRSCFRFLQQDLRNDSWLFFVRMCGPRRRAQ